MLASIAPETFAESEPVQRLLSMRDWEPLQFIEQPVAREQMEFTRALRHSRAAHFQESRGDPSGAAGHFEEAMKALNWFPFDSGLEARASEARSGAARCRRLAEDASR